MKLTNDFTKKREDWYSWWISIKGKEEELKKIEYVTYFLHPTFSPSELISGNPANKFRRDLEGWGEFLLQAEATMNDGTKRYAALWINLGFTDDEALELKKTYQGDFKDSDEWRKVKEQIEKGNIDKM
ncbi:MAG: pYEATS domain-containing protein [Candidatus Hodarchaeota archaeon]